MFTFLVTAPMHNIHFDVSANNYHEAILKTGDVLDQEYPDLDRNAPVFLANMTLARIEIASCFASLLTNA